MPSSASASLAAAALAYARAGWHVFPLRPGEKTPLLNNGVHGATCALDTVRRWWAARANANIGIALKPSGLGVIDLDVKPAKGIDGRLTYRELALLYGSCGSAAEQSTPSSGRHHVFRIDNGYGVVDRVAWQEGVDVLTAAHRYIVAAPSIVSGKRYAWADGLEPWDEVGLLSPHWAKLLRAEAQRSEQGRASTPGTFDMLDVAALRVPGVDLKELDSILSSLPASMERDSWLRVLWGAAAQWGGSKQADEVVAKLEEWSSTSDKAGQYVKGEVAKRWREHTASQGGRSGAGHVTWRSIRVMAQKAGWSPFTLGGVDPARWKTYLKTKKTEEGGIVYRPSAWNVALCLAFHERFKGSVKRNVLTNAIEMHRSSVCPLRDPTRLPRPYSDKSDFVGAGTAVESLLQGQLSPTVVNAGVIAAADVHAYDPIKQWVDALHWDGVKRLDTWISRACHAQDTALNRAISRAWVIGLAARATAEYDGRGTKMDSVLVLQGDEGIGKSTIGAVMGGEWYASFSNTLQNQEVLYVIERSIVLEFAELDALSRSEASRIKALVSTQADTFRRSYGTEAQTKPRRCVFLGTTNDEAFLTRDMTMRRWWVVRCGAKTFDMRWLIDNRDQIIAEAKAASDRGEQPVLPDEVRDAQRKMVEGVRMEHPFEEAVKEWSDKQEERAIVGIRAAVEQALNRTAISLNMHELRKFGECMRVCGWVKRHRTDGNCWLKEKP